jgi:hypothetical protein
MTVPEFDPAFSRDLRQELVSRSDAVARPRTRPHGSLPQRRALLTTIVTAVVLLFITIGVLQVVRPAAGPAAPSSGVASTVVDPLTVVTDPAQGEQFLSRSPDVLLHAIGTDGASHSATIDVPDGTTTVRIWLNCTEGAHFAISLHRHARTGTCASSDATPWDVTVPAGARVTVQYAVPDPPDASYAFLVVALPKGP